MPVPDDTLVPIPARYWWLKRILLGVLVLIVALVGLRWWWGCRRTGAGVPASWPSKRPADPCTRGTCGARDSRRGKRSLLPEGAVAAMKPATNGRTLSELTDAPDSPARGREIAQVLVDNGESLRLLRKARDARGADWGIDYSAGFAAAHPGISLRSCS